MTNLSDTLAALSEVATGGEWRDAGGDAILVGRDHDLRVVGSLTASKDDPAFIVALVNAYRTGQLVPVPSVERVAQALAKHPDSSWDDYEWEDMPSHVRTGFCEQAELVIAAMQERRDG